MSDYLVKALAYEGFVRAYAVNATETIAEAQQRHDTWNTSSAALGRTMIGALMLGATLKGEDKMTVKVEGNGPAGAIVVDSNGKGEVKGYIKNPHISLPLNEIGKIDVRGAVGTEGMFTVIKDLGLKEPFSGQTPIVSGEIGEDFTYYLAVSEQIPSAVGVSVLVDTDDSIKTAGGFMIQIMPGASEEIIDKIEERLKETARISSLLDEGQTPEEILQTLLAIDDVEFLENMPVQFKCDCSKEKFASAIITLGAKQIQELIDQDHGAEAVCAFCNNKYDYSETDLYELKQEILGE
ncbi:Hsp33 family molecular chaperone HslO [Enterococcus raffinosus]|uniref:33 kDa chaperonin n=1 Tax=Enterococcus raffinosus TaxID=71452 RepID=A0AAW8T667_9ENTE|nr:Hsp33 family molecular chaperone HslO [Enterococcus raffinosus]MDT2523596.1 Hsp33 family molecular chaperone HslO [Enterococcus raffinosus]MDT2529565.1 Hsp33 family molecular chaperone HslO [Enterococcus raffinosus]MDT2534422.1 Hsp33 family molecular chaperone HslO [Enterococcus raffinosus]MDT2544733.1 Hsp33 family molecular chaperone HslO [Enterococcus raffinosus]MDT2556078.1 Hsp33 family molecular chaperone HslO [Enterococcus raffinosus]